MNPLLDTYSPDNRHLYAGIRGSIARSVRDWDAHYRLLGRTSARQAREAKPRRRRHDRRSDVPDVRITF